MMQFSKKSVVLLLCLATTAPAGISVEEAGQDAATVQKDILAKSMQRASKIRRFAGSIFAIVLCAQVEKASKGKKTCVEGGHDGVGER